MLKNKWKESDSGEIMDKLIERFVLEVEKEKLKYPGFCLLLKKLEDFLKRLHKLQTRY